MTNTQEKLEEILDNLGERYIMVEHRLIHQGMPESNGKHKELEHAKTKISHLIESAKREAYKQGYIDAGIKALTEQSKESE